jgi:HSP20 family protein
VSTSSWRWRFPASRPEDLDISIEGRQLAIRGTLPNFSDNEERRYWLANIPRGEFSRNVTLPATVEMDNVQAQVRDGLLTLTMPKVAQAKARKIEITSG